MKLDAATVEAVKSSRKGVEAQLSHRRQLSRNTARKRANLKVITARGQASIESSRARSEAAQAIAQQRESLRTQRVINPAQRSIRSQVTEQAQTRVINKGFDTASTASHPNANLFMTTIFLIAGLAVFYNLVTKADLFSGFVGSIGNSLHKLSSTTPMFQTVATK